MPTSCIATQVAVHIYLAAEQRIACSTNNPVMVIQDSWVPHIPLEELCPECLAEIAARGATRARVSSGAGIE